MSVDFDVESFHGENEAQLLKATLTDVLPDDLPKFKKVLNDYLDNGDADDTVTDFIFNGWEDVSIICKSGKEFLICSETTFAEMLEMISA
jgi:hypothetical protein